jgi:ketosteroid isomerase-like protein
MSEQNVELIRQGFEYFQATGDVREDAFHPDFVWDMSTFRGWPERKTYAGIDGMREFFRDWRDAWDDWGLDVEALRDAGDQVVAIVRQRGRSKTTGLAVDMTFAQVYTMRDGKQIRMEMYADPSEALEAAGLSDG